MDSVLIEKGAILRLFQHLKLDKLRDPDGVPSRIMKTLRGLIVETLEIL